MQEKYDELNDGFGAKALGLEVSDLKSHLQFPMSAVLRGYQHNTQLESTHTLLRLRLFYSGSAQSNATASERRGVGGE